MASATRRIPTPSISCRSGCCRRVSGLSRVTSSAFPVKDRIGRLTLVASQDGREGSVTIHQDVNLYSAFLETGNRATLPLDSGRHIWVQVARGSVRVNNSELSAGDGAALADEPAA